MSYPKRIQRQRAKGWRKPEGAVYVGRPGVFGNPFAPAVIPGWATASRQYAVDDFEFWLRAPDFAWRRAFSTEQESVDARSRLIAALPTLSGKTLMCWCHEGQPCHADVLLAAANVDAYYEQLVREPA